MAKQQYLERYMLIIKRVRKNVCTLKEIEEYLERESDLKEINLRMSQRTFQRDLNEIRNICGVDIQYNPSKRGYEICEQGADKTNMRMMEAFDLFNVLKMSEQLSDFILFEERKPQGTEYFYPILQAIKSKNCIQIIYLKSWEGEPDERTLQPQALKEFKGRWYLLAIDEYDNRLKTYGLDRIQDLQTLKKKFETNPDLDVKAKFNYCFGILSKEDTTPETVELSFSQIQARYIKSYPLHWSQEIVSETESETRVKLQIHITYDFVMELLSYGSEVKVLSPVHLQERLKENLKNTFSQY